MNNQIKLFLSLLFAGLFQSLLIHAKSLDQVEILNLKTEYAVKPIGIDVKAPRFSWQMKASEKGYYQTAYRLIVHNEVGQAVWDSGKMLTDSSLNIRYLGLNLEARMRYTWKVTVWDHKGKSHVASSWFETGLMEQGKLYSAWNGARWIGGSEDDRVLYAHYLPVFKLNFSIQLDENTKSTTGAFIYGANDPRLLNANMNYLRLQNNKDDSYIKIELNTEPLSSGNAAVLHIFRVGYVKNDSKRIPLKSMEVPSQFINKRNQYLKHTIYISSVLGDTEIYINGLEKNNLIGSINLNPLGKGGDFIAFPVVGEIGIAVPKDQVAFFSDVEIRNFRSPSHLLFSDKITVNHQGLFSTENGVIKTSSGYQLAANDQEVMVIANPSRNAAPMLRTVFPLQASKISKARLYVTSRGIYDLYINGKRIVDDYFNPGLTQYNKTQLYQTYDVTEALVSGNNVMGAILSEGWWSGAATYMGEFWNFFGDRQSLLAQLVVTHADGQEEVIVTNPDQWKYFGDGPTRFGSFFQGEVYDAGKELAIAGWSNASFNDSLWKKSVEVPLDGNISLDERNKYANMPMVDDFSNMKLIGEFGPPVKKVSELTAVSVEEVRPGVFVYDMGQNMAGVPRIELNGMHRGDTIVLRFAEVKYPDLTEYQDNQGMIMLENIRAAMAQDIYITKGGRETVAPRFTYHGYRYIEVTGLAKPLPLQAVKSDVLSSIHAVTADYETSDPSVNKLWKNIIWSSLANFISIPTDCPQRNERLGWSGDISVFSRTATYLADMPQFLRRHMTAMRDVQSASGRFSDIAPLGGGFGGVLWGSAGITVAWESYQQYGDIDMLAEHYEAMRQYIDYLNLQVDPITGVLCEGERTNWGSLGDWLSPEYDKNEKTLLWEAYFIYDLEIMEKIATILKKNDDAQLYHRQRQERKQFFNTTYIDQISGKTCFRGKTIDTQVSYVLPLAFNIITEQIRDKSMEHFVATIVRENKTDAGDIVPPYSLMTGFIGTAWINHSLSATGNSDLAYKLLLTDSYPSWLYPVKQGATTVWERLNSYTHNHGFGGNNNMNSFNHYSFGAVGAWMYEHSLGIQRDEDSPAFKHFILNPEPDQSDQLSYAKGFYDSKFGRIESAWEKSEKGLKYTVHVPANTSATLYLKASSLSHIMHEGKLLKQDRYITYLGFKNGKFVFKLCSGSYVFNVMD
ncbi:alpha-L-rhamnosidase [Sphingobacterium faecium]|uniref:alpha-L-rhamnosidase n=1 Tax=Sphingobacterium faecium TaxID=34087 RepID=UPI003209C0A4